MYQHIGVAGNTGGGTESRKKGEAMLLFARFSRLPEAFLQYLHYPVAPLGPTWLHPWRFHCPPDGSWMCSHQWELKLKKKSPESDEKMISPLASQTCCTVVWTANTSTHMWLSCHNFQDIKPVYCWFLTR